MQDIVIIGAGGFGREVQWLIERINAVEFKWNIIGYIDDGVERGTTINNHEVLGGIEELEGLGQKIAVTCAIGASETRKNVIHKVKDYKNLYFPNLIDPSAHYSDYIEFGQGNIVCAGTIMTVNIKVDDFVIVNLDCTVGHDVHLSSFVTVYPGVHVSGCVHVGECTEVGTGTQIIQGKKLGAYTIVGAGAVVIGDLPDNGTAVGSPAKVIHYRKK